MRKATNSTGSHRGPRAESCQVTPEPGSETTPFSEEPDFSLVLGGPLHQIFRRAHLSGDTLELLKRRVILITLWAWLPLLLVSLVDGHALGGGIKIPFLRDVEAHVRFLIALPVLII